MSSNRPLGPVFENSLRDAKRLAERQPSLHFELRRRKIEAEEYANMLAMMDDDSPNTMIVVSDFPPELMNAQKDVNGYNTTRRQTMLRVITRQDDGVLRMVSQSLDRSDRTALEAIYTYFGRTPKAGELLGQRIHVELAEEEQSCIADQLMGIYDRSLSESYGGDWHAGRQYDGWRNTYEFVKSQDELLGLFVKARLNDPNEAERLRYGLAAAMQRRFENRRRHPIAVSDEINFHPGLASTMLRRELRVAAEEAASEGREFSGCGISLKQNKGMGEPTDTEAQLGQSGYGNKPDKESSSYDFDKRMYCVVCQSPHKEDEKPKMCGPCGICRACDTRIRRKRKA